MRLGQKITELRKKNNLSQEGLAEKMNVSRQAVSKWESDQSIPDIEKIVSLSELLRPYNLMCKDEQFLKVNQNWV